MGAGSRSTALGYCPVASATGLARAQSRPRLGQHEKLDGGAKTDRMHALLGAFRRCALALFFAALALRCEASSDGSRYPVYDSKLGTRGFLVDRIYWLDNDRVIFLGFDRNDPKYRPEKGEVNLGIFIWDTSNGQTRRYADAKGGLCYSQGYIVYYLGETVHKGKQGTYRLGHFMEGPMGKEKKISVRGRGLWDRTRVLNDLSCHFEEVPEQMRDRIYVPLLPGHGYLDLGSRTASEENPRAIFYRHLGAEPIALPFRKQNINWASIRYFPHKGVYVIPTWYYSERPPHVTPIPWFPYTPQPLWLLYPDGRTERIMLPWKRWRARADNTYHVTKEGILITSKNAPDYHGAYLLRGDEYEKVISGHLDGTSVSPDGCKIAFSYLRDLRHAGRHRTVRMLDLCKVP